MITKLEISGFKTFENFEMEFSPFTIIAGPNASGKSNLFDALALLTRLAETDLKTAFSEQRGEAIELFTKYDDDFADEISFAIEMLVDKKVRDNWGGESELKYTRLRYELKIKRTINERGILDLAVAYEVLVNLKHNEDVWLRNHLKPEVREIWRPKVSTGKRGKPYILTEDREGTVTIYLAQDGKSGNKKATPANAVLQTVLSSINSVDFPHVFAAKEEMRKWRFLQLSPDALRKPSPYMAKDTISHHGENLAAVLYRIKNADISAIKDIARRLNNLLPTIVDVDVYDDSANKQFIVKVKNDDGREFSSRVLSEGTLRLLALCVFLYDETFGGLLCFEEPENGIHPFRLKAMVELLNDLSIDFNDVDMPLRQVLVNTHSPVLVGEVFQLKEKKNISVWFSRLITKITKKSGVMKKLHVTKIFSVDPSSQGTLFQNNVADNNVTEKITQADLKNYLQTAYFPEMM
ncbi:MULTISPECIES: ATP-binding protein [unclassified Sulfurospirillum]|uniref:AAA family ATPase n=1 Tax=unclassified Sulfurospirillum TaxID=2618290 RepID=UPI000508BB9E|nr:MULTISPECIES: ATP-binding protein [unclassified Sulfurospirillum]KFL33894.1 ATPase [Sulfurospirillum sp. SCADC]